MSLTERLLLIATELVAKLGYGGLALVMAANAGGVPIPSEVVLPLAGALLHQGRLAWLPTVLVAIIAQAIGASFAYWLASTGGLEIVRRYGKYVLFRERELNKTQAWFDRYGAKAVLIGSCLPGLRSYIAYPAGLANMPRRKFLIAYMCGTTAWTIGMLAAGYWLQDQLPVIAKILHGITLIIIILLIVGVIWYVKRQRKGK